jgi:hypothetical protein
MHFDKFEVDFWERWFFLLRTTIIQRSTESRGFSPGTPVSCHRECLQSGLLCDSRIMIVLSHEALH